jgi:DNA-binding transcriptional LysR family regulator
MNKLASLDLLKGFEAAARHLSFTQAAAELCVTQSAVSRQIKTLEDQLGVALFQRRNRALLLTDAGQILHRTAAEMLRLLAEATERITQESPGRLLTVSTTVSFASLWLVPRLVNFRRRHPDIDVRISANNEMVNLQRQRIDLAVRFCEPKAAPAGAIPLAREEVFPVCSPALLRDRARPLRKPADLARHVLLHLDDAASSWPWFNWAEWLQEMGVPELKPAGALRFSHYDQLIRAAIDGEGIALGRNPLVMEPLRRKQLVTPFARKAISSREYYILLAPESANRKAVADFTAWLMEEVRQDSGILHDGGAANETRRKRRLSRMT